MSFSPLNKSALDPKASYDYVNATLVEDVTLGATLAAVFVLIVGFLGNILGMMTFLHRQAGVKTHVVDRIIGLLFLTGLITTCVSAPIQLHAFLKGQFSIGPTLCRMQGFSLNLLCLLSLWYSSVLAFERFLFIISPHEHRLTFSPLNLNVILSGVFVLQVVEVSGPVYGWAQYGYVKESVVCLLYPKAKHIFSYSVIHTSCYVVLPFAVTFIAMACVIHEGCKKNNKLIQNSMVLKSSEGMIVLALAAIFSSILFLPYHVVLLLQAWEIEPSFIAKTSSYWLHIIAICCVYPTILFSFRTKEIIPALKQLLTSFQHCFYCCNLSTSSSHLKKDSDTLNHDSESEAEKENANNN